MTETNVTPDSEPTSLVSLPSATASLLDVFTKPGEIDPYLKRIRAVIDGFEPDITTAKGRQAIKSLAHRVTRSKTYIDDYGKALTAEYKTIPDKIDATRKRVRDTLAEWSEEARAPLTKWEADEKARKDACAAKLARLNALAMPMIATSAEIRAKIAEASAVTAGSECHDMREAITTTAARTLASLQLLLDSRLVYEAEQAELANLRRENEARQRAEAEARAAHEAAEARARAERAAAEQRERSMQVEIDAEKSRAEAEKLRAEQAEQKAAADAAAKAAAEKAEQERAAASKKRKAAVNRAALAALVEHAGLDEASAKATIEAIVTGKIPNVSISY